MKQFHFVCPCQARFFKSYDSAICPRCGKQLRSNEKLPLPLEAQQEIAVRRAEIFLFARGLHPMQEPLLVRALTDFFMKGGEPC